MQVYGGIWMGCNEDAQIGDLRIPLLEQNGQCDCNQRKCRRDEVESGNKSLSLVSCFQRYSGYRSLSHGGHLK